MARITVKCNNCGKDFSTAVDLSDIDFEVAETNERQMGKETLYSARIYIDCPSCNESGEIIFDCWEYPIGAFNYCEIYPDSGSFSVISSEGCESICAEHIQKQL